eukprot:494510-Pleurochrysis_carterae.AAC.1
MCWREWADPARSAASDAAAASFSLARDTKKGGGRLHRARVRLMDAGVSEGAGDAQKRLGR